MGTFLENDGKKLIKFLRSSSTINDSESEFIWRNTDLIANSFEDLDDFTFFFFSPEDKFSSNTLRNFYPIVPRLMNTADETMLHRFGKMVLCRFYTYDYMDKIVDKTFRIFVKELDLPYICTQEENGIYSQIQRYVGNISFIPGSPLFLDIEPFLKAPKIEATREALLIRALVIDCMDYLKRFHKNTPYFQICDAIRALLNALARFALPEGAIGKINKDDLTSFLQTTPAQHAKAFYSYWGLFNTDAKVFFDRANLIVNPPRIDARPN